MKRIKPEEVLPVNESFLGGAAISRSDLAMIESQEIQWSFIAHQDDYLEDRN
ncbi:hypothetical protein [Prochlorococcus marinus]|uniref:Uncharacterized protein n=1 Tax=Prochlorococcus marinus (strain MIT 9211) TaxID=93059 RepID=A9BBY8_PROM4|nr:hypothetical protein [Prochlorococcus marinus]ABX09350.1 Hypothetical protein P9211_14191 [Prochlorococcus marinus str. MIT 9211]